MARLQKASLFLSQCLLVFELRGDLAAGDLVIERLQRVDAFENVVGCRLDGLIGLCELLDDRGADPGDHRSGEAELDNLRKILDGGGGRFKPVARLREAVDQIDKVCAHAPLALDEIIIDADVRLLCRSERVKT